MNREIHVRFWESAGVRFPRATQLAAIEGHAHAERRMSACVSCGRGHGVCKEKLCLR